MAERLPQIIVAFDSTLKLDKVLHTDVQHVDPAGAVTVIERGVLGLARVALQGPRRRILDENVMGAAEKKLLTDAERDAGRLTPWFLTMLESQRFDYRLLLDNIGGSQASLMVLDLSREALRQRGVATETYGGSKLHSASALLALGGAPLHTLEDTELLFHSPHDPEALRLLEQRITEPGIRELLDDMADVRRQKNAGIHAMIASRVTGFFTRMGVKWKLRKARNDKTNKLGDVTFKATELPGVVTDTAPSVPALAKVFTNNSGVEIRTDHDYPADRFFTMMHVRRNAIERAIREVGPPVDMFGDENGDTGFKLGGRKELGDRVNAIFNDEFRAVRAEGTLKE